MNDIIMPLYTPLMPDNTGRLVHKQHFNRNKVTVALRPLSLPGDWPVISKWMNRDLSRSTTHPWQLPVKHLQETLAMMLQCDFAQPFVGIINAQPAFMIEICDGEKQLTEYEAGCFIAERGDHMINIIMSPTVINTRNWLMYAMYTSLHYFFSHEHVQRIVWLLHDREKHFTGLANQCGFIKNSRYNWPGVHVYLYSREKFMRFSDNWQQEIQKQA
ncbi:GNAT family N-acetyltransferase [Niastella populi]|uniref:N-acetyltransferase domain-containing protein n=1 Tax=Niastella populi TaxID=550983 RepID=A0A1V9FLZ7_9BACT|nr:GNAT family N-acetyltransferase [Niastella populi]OQP59373.1 hypothetical protein A4R26_21390 [Niastella populi]